MIHVGSAYNAHRTFEEPVRNPYVQRPTKTDQAKLKIAVPTDRNPILSDHNLIKQRCVDDGTRISKLNTISTETNWMHVATWSSALRRRVAQGRW